MGHRKQPPSRSPFVAQQVKPPLSRRTRLHSFPPYSLAVSFETEHGTRQASFEGPLLWTVLDHAHVVPAKPGDQVRRIVVLAGRDGYIAVLALGEIAPDFENKQVVLAEKMDGQPLGSEHFRIVVPGDKRGGRSVRDLMRIDVIASPPTDARQWPVTRLIETEQFYR